MSKLWVHTAVVTTIAGVSLACLGSDSPPEVVDNPVPVVPAPSEVQVEPVPTAQPEPIPRIDDELEFIGRLPPVAYGNSWLVIVASTPTPEPIPPEVLALEEGARGMLAADRLDSGQYKGLMPCWSIAIAGASEDRAVATEMLEILKSNGVDGYIKFSGEFVGEDPRVQAVCEDMRSDSANNCPADARMAQVIDGHWHMQVPVPAELAERVMAGAPAPRATDEYKSLWTAPLTAETVGDVGVGDTVFIDETTGAQNVGQCTVTGFAAVTQGIAHFSYDEFGDTSKPGCGTPEPWAVLDCAGVELGGPGLPTTGIATSRVDTAESWRPLGDAGPAKDADGRAAVAVAASNSEFSSARATAQAAADEQGETLNEETTVQAFTGPAGSGFVVTTRWWTRDGEAYCGNDDVLVSRTAGVVNGRVVSNVADTTYATLLGVVEFGSEPTAQVVTRPMFGGITVGHEDAECGITVAFCSCAC